MSKGVVGFSSPTNLSDVEDKEIYPFRKLKLTSYEVTIPFYFANFLLYYYIYNNIKYIKQKT